MLLVCLYSSITNGQATNKKNDSLKILIRNTKIDTDKIILLLQLSKNIDCNDTAEKFKYVYQGLGMADDKKWQRGIILANNTLGNIYYDCFKSYSTAIIYYQKAALIAKTNGDKENETSGPYLHCGYL